MLALRDVTLVAQSGDLGQQFHTTSVINGFNFMVNRFYNSVDNSGFYYNILPCPSLGHYPCGKSCSGSFLIFQRIFLLYIGCGDLRNAFGVFTCNDGWVGEEKDIFGGWAPGCLCFCGIGTPGRSRVPRNPPLSARRFFLSERIVGAMLSWLVL